MKAYPLNKAFTFIEPGPVVLVTTSNSGKHNILSLSWTMVLDFTPRFAFMTGSWNYSYKALIKKKECVIAIPTANMSKTVASIGSCSGANVDKFAKFKLTPLDAVNVNSPLIQECYANIECQIIDHIKKHNIFILDGVQAWVNEKIKDKRLIHAIGDGRFKFDGDKINHRKIMQAKIPKGV